MRRDSFCFYRALVALIFSLMTALFLTGCGSSSSSSSTSSSSVTCNAPIPQADSANQWTWVGGSDKADAAGVYGTQGLASANNVPGARESSTSWSDKKGDLWLFGGFSPAQGELNDLWKFSLSDQTWVWISGNDTGNAVGVYGTMGVASASNVPGARKNAGSWVDEAGNFWIFGGYGLDSTGSLGNLNDLWEFDPAAKTWTWVSGSYTTNAFGIYGSASASSAGNVPGARSLSVTWTDHDGNFWLLGGSGAGASDFGNLDDMWKFSPTSLTWTWIGGSSAINVNGNWGTIGVPSTSNDPGGRYDSVSWVDNEDNLWIFGGDNTVFVGEGVTGGIANDLWKFDAANKQWTWFSGSQISNTPGVYGTMGSADSNNIPGVREDTLGWIDQSSNLWVFGGFGFATALGAGGLNDLWEFNPTTKLWTWVGGSNALNTMGTYGGQGVSSASNIPGARSSSVTWTDCRDRFWLFGGVGRDSLGNQGRLNDLWLFQP